MSKRKLTVVAGEWFINRTDWTSIKMTNEVEIYNFLKKIECKEDKGKRINTPMFKIGSVEMYIGVIPGYKKTRFVRVAVANFSQEDQMTSVTVEAPGLKKKSKEMVEIRAGQSWDGQSSCLTGHPQGRRVGQGLSGPGTRGQALRPGGKVEPSKQCL